MARWNQLCATLGDGSSAAGRVQPRRTWRRRGSGAAAPWAAPSAAAASVASTSMTAMAAVTGGEAGRHSGSADETPPSLAACRSAGGAASGHPCRALLQPRPLLLLCPRPSQQGLDRSDRTASCLTGLPVRPVRQPVPRSRRQCSSCTNVSCGRLPLQGRRAAGGGGVPAGPQVGAPQDAAPRCGRRLRQASLQPPAAAALTPSSVRCTASCTVSSAQCRWFALLLSPACGCESRAH